MPIQMKNMHKEFPIEKSVTCKLIAGQTDAMGLMPLTSVTQQLIELATLHANDLSIGATDLSTQQLGWVLSRLSIEMKRYPGVNENYTLTTWIEGYNRHFSDRCFEMRNSDTGELLGQMRSVWTAIDVKKRTVADLTAFEPEQFPLGSRKIDIEKVERCGVLPETASRQTYTFKYCDIDFNRHVNTVRYLTLLLNHWSLEHFENNEIRRIDLCFHHECYYGEEAELRVFTSDNRSHCEILRDGTRAVGAVIRWSPRE